MRVRSIVTALFLASAAVIPLSSPSAAATSPSVGSCREGAMFAAGQGFYTCVQGQYVYRECGPGTVPQQIAQDVVICNYA
ncbi:hypothetical protein FNV62_07580 [Streptomyces sp. RLB3-17]|uniref:hypothetical protein n=1 Tax=unclassified Streptomyces TaxID=2593676 RepID=UPI001161D55F|nr:MULTISPECIES: hypothetical protein [unclassified Streptomyces]NMI56025.1 hypothetical protein [Streptomyces sp. RLA2-12]QDN55478.1 hypothetical protein FNV67_09340 [Streptomyces sp. S1D4-20]QDN65656.1 hypothetical protein FNV66_08935 [Streptomyces sp. S1D4-14]QDN96300.1 hypothetical protein FNV58_10090 [Streptomyces sp. RLB1-9]QDO18009.1 hypothetical protein FNV65_08540 [Streptomyces sp. S1A1-8]